MMYPIKFTALPTTTEFQPTTDEIATTTEAATTETMITTEGITTTEFEITTTSETATTAVFGDPHFNIMLPNKQSLCFTLQGEHGFVFNLISNELLQMNALFVPDKERSEVTWLGSLGLVVKNARFKNSNVTKLRLMAEERMIYIGDKIKLHAESIEKLTFVNGKLKIAEAIREKDQKVRLEVQIDLVDLGLNFVVWFVKGNHLDMMWNNVLQQPKISHGIIGMSIELYSDYHTLSSYPLSVSRSLSDCL